MTRVLVVDDEPQILRALRINLRVRSYDVDIAATGSAALEAAAKHPPDLVILDLGLPDLDGVEVIEGLRGWTEAPIIVLSGRADSTDKVEALDAGADDYVTKPFGMEELLARMRAAVRRSGPDTSEPQVRLGDLIVDLAAKRVIRDGAEDDDGADVRLTPDRVAPAGGAAAQPGQAAQPAPAAHRGLGPGVRGRDREPAAVHGPAAPQAGARPGPAALAADRARHGLPVPAQPGRGRRSGRASAGYAAPVDREQIEVRYTKWGGIDHYHFAMELLGQDEHGWWLFGRRGMTMQRGAEPEVRQPRDFALLVPAEGDWTACFNVEGDLDIYADVTTRPVLTARPGHRR